MPKIVILNQATVHPDWQYIDQAGQNTWGCTTHPDVKMFHYYGAFDSNHQPYSRFSNIPNRGEVIILPNNIMVCGTNDGLGDYFDPRGEKYILALEYCLNNFEFDYLYRTTCTSYVDIFKMHDYFSKLDIKEKLYDGARNMYNYQYFFVTSYHEMLSRDVVEIMVKHKQEFLDLKYPEDLATGILITDILKYASFENIPNHTTSVWSLGDNFDPNHYTDTSIFNYRLNPNLKERLFSIYNCLEEYRKLNIIK
jgi:hypothetical protein